MRSHRQRGFTLAEILIASAMFIFIASSAIFMVNQFQKISYKTDVELKALRDGNRGLSQIAKDVHVAAYVYHWATIAFTQIPMPGGTTFTTTAPHFVLPLIVEATPTVDIDTWGNNHRWSSPTKAGGDVSMPVLALILDQPLGLSRPRYVVYFRGSEIVSERFRSGDGFKSVYPLYRMEFRTNNPPRSWYAFNNQIAAGQATSGIEVDMGTTPPQLWTPRQGVAGAVSETIIADSWRLTKVADMVARSTDPAPTPFVLRSYHPWSNQNTIAPMLVRVAFDVKIGYGYDRTGSQDTRRMETRAFARNLPAPSSE